MIDIRLIRENSEAVRANCVRRGFPIDIDGLLKLDADARQLGQEAEALRAERNRLSKECAKDPSARDKVKSSRRCSPPRRRCSAKSRRRSGRW